jgi:MFS transporter, FSR family, fosmidomycin resistance protein
MTASAAAATGGRKRVIGLLCTGHFYSHFSNLVLPPLFPFLRAETGLDYVALAGLVAAPAVATGVSQVPFGMLVDRFGGRPVLLAGLAAMAAGFALVGVATEYWQFFALMILVGLGNGVFHPSDYAIITERIADSHLGRAVSLHGFSGYIGWAAAPAVMLGLTGLAGWRAAVSAIGLLGLAIVLIMLVFGACLRDRAVPDQRRDPVGAAAKPSSSMRGLKLMMSFPMLMMLGFFLLTAISTSGTASFLVVASMELYGVDEALGNSALTAYLVAMAVGVLAGGVIADWYGRHNLVASLSVAVFAAALAVFGLGLTPLAVAMAAMALGGLGFGIATPSRDLLVRRAAPPGTVGVAFGFASTGLGLGGAIGPVLFGWFMDAGAPGLGFAAMAGCAMLAMVTVVLTREHAADAAADAT